jgi:alpha-amylase
LIENGKKKGVTTEMKKDAFSNTGYQKHRYYIIKWLTDYIDYGIDGYRADTVKHTEASVWADFKAQSEYAFATWKKTIQQSVRQQLFYTKYTTITLVPVKVLILDKKVNYFENGFNSMINFEFK